MRICLIASSRFPVREPFAGGLEALTHVLARELVHRGHDVTLYAAPGSDPTLPVRELSVPRFESSDSSRLDVNAPSETFMHEHHAYLGLMLALARDGGRYDVVHNNSLHHLPVAMAHTLQMPLVTTLHTPPLAWLESAIALSRHVRGLPAGPGRATDAVPGFVAVSHHTARAWAHVVDATTIHNGVDVDAFVPGPGGGPVVWSGRLVAEKAPHEAIAACREAGVDLVLAGPTPDRGYFEAMVRPALGPHASYVGHLAHRELVALLGSASAAVLTPAWDEPYGLVAAEALACGTPVAAYARGALSEVLTPETGVLARPGDHRHLAQAIDRARGLSRVAARARAVDSCSLDRMVTAYEHLYAGLARRDVAA